MTQSFHPITTRYIPLGMAVKIKDGFTGELPISEPVLYLNDVPIKSYGNWQTGFWSTTEAKHGQSLVVKAPYYFPSPAFRIDLKHEDQRTARQFEAWLKPRPNYPYPRGAMIRGLVTGPDLQKPEITSPLSGVVVEASYNAEKFEPKPITLTDNQGRYNGRYALYIKYLEENYFKNRGGVEVTLTFKKEGYENGTVTTETRYLETTFCNANLSTDVRVGS